MTILAIVNASKEGQIESKMLRSRHMEEIREARRKEAEARQEEKKSKLVCGEYHALSFSRYIHVLNDLQEETKDSIRRKRKRKPDTEITEPAKEATKPYTSAKSAKKRVAFAN